MRIWLLSAVCLGLAGCEPADRDPLMRSDSADTSPSLTGPTVSDSSDSVAQVSQPRVPRAAEADDWFEDLTHRSGVDFSYRNGREGGQYTLLETVGGGVAMLDYNGDGHLDLFFPGGGRITGSPPKIEGLPPALYRNEGDWRFVDVTEEAGLLLPTDYSIGCAVGDFDRDGFPDLFVTCYGRSRLFRNDQQGGFVDVTESSGLVVDGFSTAAVWADVDGNGWPDLLVVGYVEVPPEESRFCGDRLRKIQDVCGPWQYPPAQDRLFRNLGNGTFEEITETAGLSGEGKGLGVLAADFNGDGWMDFYVANDTTRNHLYLGGPEGRFQEVGLLSGTAFSQDGTPEGSMGVDLGDYDGDGQPDLFVTNYEREDNALYQHLGGADFAHATTQTGLGNISRPYVGFGTGFVDFTSDGWQDLFVINGHVQYHTGQSPYLQPALLFRNLQGQGFRDVSELGGPYFSIPHAGRGAAVGDLDNDGAMDLVVVHQNAPVTLLKNRLTPDNWVRVELRGTDSDPAAVGAVVSAMYQGRKLVRWVRGGAGYLSHFDRRILFPADSDDAQQVTVRWLTGMTERFGNLAVRETHLLVEGRGERVPNEK